MDAIVAAELCSWYPMLDERRHSGVRVSITYRALVSGIHNDWQNLGESLTVAMFSELAPLS